MERWKNIKQSIPTCLEKAKPTERKEAELRNMRTL